MSGCVYNVEQTATPALPISFPPNLGFSRLSGIMVTASPFLTQLIFFVKASNVCGSKQEMSTELVKWKKSELTKGKSSPEVLIRN